MSTELTNASNAVKQLGTPQIYHLMDGETANGTYANKDTTTTGTQVMQAGRYAFEAWGTWDGADITLTGRTPLMTSLLANNSINLTSAAPRMVVEIVAGEFVAAVLNNAGASTSLSASLTLLEAF